MEFHNYSSSETFVMLGADQFVGCDDGFPEQERQDSHVRQRNCSLILRKTRSPHHKGDED